MSQPAVSFVATVYAWDTSAGTYKTGDAANITLYWTKDGTQSVTTNACSEVSAANAPGQYKVTLTSTEATCTAGTVGGKSATAGIIIIPAQFTFDNADFTSTQKTSLGTAVAASPVASVTAGVTVTTNNDKTGYALSAAGVQAVWDALTSALTTVGSIGKLFVDNLNATISSRMATFTQPTGFLAATFPTTVASPTNITAGTVTTVTNLTNAPTAGDLTATMKASVKTQMVNALTVDTYAEPTSVPASTSSIKDKLSYVFTKARNKVTQTATTQLVRNDTDAATIATITVSDDGTTFIKGVDT